MEQNILAVLSNYNACWKNYTVRFLFYSKDNNLNNSLYPATDGYPLAMLPIGNKPLLSYQIEYLERNGINEIFVVVEKRYVSKIETYFGSFFKANEKTDIELVALQDEEESANVLKLLKDKINVTCHFLYALTY
jgi:NDP-sugar pyrophosphorylase family protein